MSAGESGGGGAPDRGEAPPLADEAARVARPPDGSDASSNQPDSAEPDPKTDARTYTCDLCGAVMLDLHCKLVCERCGYKRDCSDP